MFPRSTGRSAAGFSCGKHCLLRRLPNRAGARRLRLPESLSKVHPSTVSCRADGSGARAPRKAGDHRLPGTRSAEGNEGFDQSVGKSSVGPGCGGSPSSFGYTSPVAPSFLGTSVTATSGRQSGSSAPPVSGLSPNLRCSDLGPAEAENLFIETTSQQRKTILDYTSLICQFSRGSPRDGSP